MRGLYNVAQLPEMIEIIGLLTYKEPSSARLMGPTMMKKLQCSRKLFIVELIRLGTA